ncbi:uncharacterized protein METZ01_LOCUS475187, partial [marine metagenome]
HAAIEKYIAEPPRRLFFEPSEVTRSS